MTLWGTYLYMKFSGCSWRRRRRSWSWFVGSLRCSGSPWDVWRGWPRGTEGEGEEAPGTGRSTFWEGEHQSVELTGSASCFTTPQLAKNVLSSRQIILTCVKNKLLTCHSNLFGSRSPNQKMNCEKRGDRKISQQCAKAAALWLRAKQHAHTCTCLLQIASLSSIYEASVHLPDWCL